MLHTAAASTSQRTPPAVTGHLTPRYNSELSPVTHATLHRPLPLSEQSLGHHLMFSFCGIYLPLFTHKSRYTCHRKTKPNITVNCSFLHRTTSQSLCHWAAMKHRTPSPTFPLKGCIGRGHTNTHGFILKNIRYANFLTAMILALWHYGQVTVRVLPRHHCTVALGKLLTPVCLCHQAL